MLTAGTMELVEGSIVTGSSRLVAGLMQLALLVLGIVVPARSAHVSESAGLLGGNAPRVGAWAPCLGTVLFRSRPRIPCVARSPVRSLHSPIPDQRPRSADILLPFSVLPPPCWLRSMSTVICTAPFLVTFLPALWLLVPGVLSAA
jgi:hypothetical protein